MIIGLASAALIAACAPATPSSAPAAPAPTVQTTTKPDAEAFKAALALLDGRDIEKQLLATTLQLVQTSLDADLEAQRKRGIEMPPTLVERLRSLVFEHVESMVDEISPTFRTEVATVYARHFTAEELRELKRLQQNPVAKKFQQLTPQLVGELSRIGADKAAEHLPEIKQKTEELVEQWLKEQKLVGDAPQS